jgi:hypothetical protein
MTDFQENQIAQEGMQLIRGKLPEDWSFDRLERLSPESGADFSVRLKAPDGKESRILIEVKTRPNPNAVGSAFTGLEKTRMLFMAPFLSASLRRRLRDAGLNFADLTGNVRLSIARPSLFVETSGAAVDPSPAQAKRSLKGSKAARIIRALIDNRPPLRLTDVAHLTSVDIGYISRVLAQLSDEGLISRNRRGPITTINWEDLIRRWADDYKVTKSNATTYCLEPRGLPRLLDQLRQVSFRYALTGSPVASLRAPVAPLMLAMLYVEDSGIAASALDLRFAEVGGNVVMLVPRDALPLEGTTRESDLVLAAPSQVAVDLLTGPGRSASEAEAFIDWMKNNENVWRH